MEDTGKLIAHGKGALRAGPYRKLSVTPLGDGSARFERGMRNERNCVRRVQTMRSERETLLHRAALFSKAIVALLCGILLEIGKDLAAGNLWNFLPLHAAPPHPPLRSSPPRPPPPHPPATAPPHPPPHPSARRPLAPRPPRLQPSR